MLNEQEKVRFEELALTDDQFLKNLVSAQNAEETLQVLRENGFNLAIEEVKALIEQGTVSMKKATEDNELREEDLESVAGGGKWRGRVRFIGALARAAALGAGLGALCAVCPAAAVALPYVAAYAGITSFDWVVKGYEKKGW